MENINFDEIEIRKLIQMMKDIKQINDIFPELTISAKSNYSQLKITNYNENHNSEMELEFFENSWIIKGHNFPEKAASSLKINSCSSLKNAIETFLLISNNLMDYYEAIDSLTSNCKVIEPNENSKETWRLIKYSKFIFIKVEFVNPLDVRMHLNISFYGKEGLVKEISDQYFNDIDDDDNEEDEFYITNVYRKICSRLNVLDFPAVCENSEEEEDECSICLCHENEKNQVPYVCCDNLKCDKLFHVSCLSQHLNINSVKILSVALADCPFCKQKISSNFISLIQSNPDN